MGVYLRAKVEVSSVILTSFRQAGGGGNFTPPPPPLQNEPLKSPYTLKYFVPYILKVPSTYYS